MAVAAMTSDKGPPPTWEQYNEVVKERSQLDKDVRDLKTENHSLKEKLIELQQQLIRQLVGRTTSGQAPTEVTPTGSASVSGQQPTADFKGGQQPHSPRGVVSTHMQHQQNSGQQTHSLSPHPHPHHPQHMQLVHHQHPAQQFHPQHTATQYHPVMMTMDGHPSQYPQQVQQSPSQFSMYNQKVPEAAGQDPSGSGRSMSAPPSRATTPKCVSQPKRMLKSRPDGSATPTTKPVGPGAKQRIDKTPTSGDRHRVRHHLSKEQINKLASFYNSEKMPTRNQKLSLAEETGMEFKSVHIWFQNRRANERKSEKTQSNGQQEKTEGGEDAGKELGEEKKSSKADLQAAVVMNPAPQAARLEPKHVPPVA